MNQSLALTLLMTLISGCASAPQKQIPEWTMQPTRMIDSGFIVYVGKSTAATVERAQFRAEGMALGDLANECSMIPKGTRIEDRFVDGETAYVKLALELQECEQAKKTVAPDEIRKLASLGFTSQLKRYQDLEETGELPSASESAEVQVNDEIQPPPSPNAIASNDNSSVHFYAMRQYVTYQKEIVISHGHRWPFDQSLRARQA